MVAGWQVAGCRLGRHQPATCNLPTCNPRRGRMRILVTISGARIEAILGQVAARVGLAGENEWLALHVTDTRPLDEVGGLGRGLLGRGRRAAEMLARIQETAAASAGRELALAEA